MRVTLLSYTHINPNLPNEHPVRLGAGTLQEGLIEYAGRVCYRSDALMGKNPDFIRARVREGHEDIVEHVRFIFRLEDVPLDADLLLLAAQPTVAYTDLGNGSWIVSMNARNVRDFWRKSRSALAWELLRLAAAIVPSVYADVETPLERGPIDTSERSDVSTCQRANVTLLGFVPVDGVVEPEKHGAATFLVEGISRACSHQIVRHRLASFSQESQRYVSLEKGGWQAVVPPAIAANPEANAVLEQAWADLQAAYARLRELGIRKEDARFLLPNAAETRLVMSMDYGALRHFFWLRLDKAAQWEIRRVARAMLELVEPLAPAVFADIVAAFPD
ncbi:MAG: FAD-dependent thymidylate synthase [Anaerolineae bacterium]|nr:FAD-dependent thymidylate synthase [Caldilineales bacterium]MDW8268771.1 FAD-dependent thymidylate synthase [Anaerolineae bacterium]